MPMERRYTQLAIRDVDQSAMKIGGYAALFDVETELWPGINEKVAQGAFTDSLAADEVRALWSHNPDMPLGTNGGPTPNLRVWEDGVGLGFDLELPDTQQGRDSFKLIKAGIVRGMSFGFEMQEFTWFKQEGDKPKVRTLNKVKLWEISPTPFPAYPQTSVNARDLEQSCEEFCKPSADLSILKNMRWELVKRELQLMRDRLR